MTTLIWVLLAILFSPILFFLLVLTGILFGWVLGCKVRIKMHGKSVGYVRWFRFYKGN